MDSLCLFSSSNDTCRHLTNNRSQLYSCLLSLPHTAAITFPNPVSDYGITDPFEQSRVGVRSTNLSTLLGIVTFNTSSVGGKNSRKFNHLFSQKTVNCGNEALLSKRIRVCCVRQMSVFLYVIQLIIL